MATRYAQRPTPAVGYGYGPPPPRGRAGAGGGGGGDNASSSSSGWWWWYAARRVCGVGSGGGAKRDKDRDGVAAASTSTNSNTRACRATWCAALGVVVVVAGAWWALASAGRSGEWGGGNNPASAWRVAGAELARKGREKLGATATWAVATLVVGGANTQSVGDAALQAGVVSASSLRGAAGGSDSDKEKDAAAAALTSDLIAEAEAEADAETATNDEKTPNADAEPEQQDPSSQPGMVFSDARLSFEPDKGVMARTYAFHLTREPRDNVTVAVRDPSGCISRGTKHRALLRVVFTPQTFSRPVWVRAALLKDKWSCPHGLVHSLRSADPGYDGLHVRIFMDVVSNSSSSSSASASSLAGQGKRQSSAASSGEEENNESAPNAAETATNDEESAEEKSGAVVDDDPESVGPERTDGWVPEEVLETEEGPARALAPLERSRSAFNFFKSDFACRTSTRARNEIVCFLGRGTQHEMPFFVRDPLGGLDEDGWNGFPVVLVTGGVHGSEAAGALAAKVIADSWNPRRGRLIIVPAVNVRALRAGLRGVPDSAHHTKPVDLNRLFPESGDPPSTGVAHDVWRLATAIRPDLLFDLHEGWGVFTQLKDNPHDRLVGSKTFSKGSSVIASLEAVPIAEVMVQAVNRDLPSQRKFEVIERPVAGGLAAKLAQTFRTRALVTETTKDQDVAIRVRQHLTMVGAALAAANVMPQDFLGSKAFVERLPALNQHGPFCLSLPSSSSSSSENGVSKGKEHDLCVHVGAVGGSAVAAVTATTNSPTAS